MAEVGADAGVSPAGRGSGDAPLPAGWRLAYVGLGANLGDARATLLTACESLAGLPGTRWLRRSWFYESAPVDASGPTFLNAVALIATELAPLRLLAELQAIEQHHGRERPYRNAPRTLDLDLLLLGDEQIDLPTLVVPHPRVHQRAFALAPLVELDAALVLPQGPAAALLAGITDQPIRRLAESG
jgi:2-amino-4-hydroxy-6-hydroxymethyldihydropteridine diphosphokinase